MSRGDLFCGFRLLENILMKANKKMMIKNGPNIDFGIKEKIVNDIL